jgi:S-DNA-T family DNA segregation ATPase FtsK/SpoIIIE
MLFTTPDISKPRRIQGVLIEEKEVKQITDHIRMERAPEYNHDIITQPVQLGGKGGVVADMDTGDSEYPDAVKVVVDAGKASASMLQRRLRVGYAKAARLIETMEEQGIVGPADGSRPRDVLITSLDELDGDDTEEAT